jgi:hypothetical protein
MLYLCCAVSAHALSTPIPIVTAATGAAAIPTAIPAEPEVRVKWVRPSYHNGLKHGAIGGGLAIAARGDLSGCVYALAVEVLALRPVKLDTAATLRIADGGATLLELSPATTPWPVSSSAGAKIKGYTAYSMRQSHPIDAQQLQSLLSARKPMIWIAHTEGLIELKLRISEIEEIGEFVESQPCPPHDARISR